MDQKFVQSIGRKLQRYAATPRRASQLAAELAHLESFMERQARRLEFEDEPASFAAVRQQVAKPK
jgi:hypothetical protein